MSPRFPMPFSTRRFSHPAVTLLTLAGIMLVALYFRSLNLAGWDNRNGLHPDERFIRDTAVRLRVPRSFGDYLTSVCPDPMPSPSNPDAPPEERREPSLESGCSTLNPRNFNWSHRYVYGAFPTTLTRIAAETLIRTREPTPDDILIVGRAMATLFDLLTLLVVFLLARTLYGRNVGLLAAALYACAVMPIQQSHFFTTDNFGVTFVTLALFFGVRMARRGRVSDAVLSGMALGAATACKISLGAAVVVPVVAALVAGFSRWRGRAWGGHRARIYDLAPESRRPHGPRRALVLATALLAAAGLGALAMFRVAEADAFVSPDLWNLRLEPRFVAAIKDIRNYVDGTVDWPPAHQWAGRTPYLYPWRNMVQWGMGVPLGVAAWVGWLAAFWLMLRRRAWLHLVPWLWIAVYWGWQGREFSPFMRYYLPIYPPLIVFAAWALYTAGGRLGRTPLANSSGGAPGRWRRWAPLLAPLVLLATFGWAWAFTRIYTRPHSRVVANAWISANLPDGARITSEQWDDALPGDGNVSVTETGPFEDDEPGKFLGRFVDDEWKPGLIEQLAQTDYVGISSARVYGAVQRLPHRYPATLRYYQALFDGSLGFDLVGDFVSLPTILGVPIDDTGAEESFTVYDHPRVFIFKRTERFTPENAQSIIVGDQVWDEVYRTSARLTNEAPTMLRLPERVWKSLATSDTAYLLHGPAGLAALLLWLGAVELLGFAAFGIAWHWRLFPPQRALGLARFLGLVLFAVPPALVATRWSVGRVPLAAWYGLVVAFGLRLAWFRRREIRATWREARGMFLQQEAVYAAFLLLGLAIRLLAASPGGAGDELQLAQWLAVLRSPAFPPYDPLFAGGHLAVPYAALLPVAAVAKLVGIGAPLGFDLAHATLFALLALLVWVTLAPARGRRSAPRAAGAPRILAEQSLEQREVEESAASVPTPEPASAASSPMARRPRLWPTLVPLLGAGLALVPGLPAGPWREPGAVGALLSGGLAQVGALMLVAGAITLALEAMRRTDRRGLRSSAGVLLLWLLTLALLAGQSIALLGIVTGLVAGIGLLERGREAARWVVIAAVAALIAAVLGRGWNWSVVQPVLQSSPAPAVWMFLAAICVPLLPALLMLARDVTSALGIGRGSAALAIVVMVATAGAWVSARVPQAAAGILGRFALAVPMAAAALVALVIAGRISVHTDRPRPAVIQDLLLAAAGFASLALAAWGARSSSVEHTATLLNVGGLLFALVGGRYLVLLARSSRPAMRRAALGATIVVLALAVTTTSTGVAARRLASQPSTIAVDAPVSAALAALSADADGLPVVAAAGAEGSLPPSVVRSGFPTLLAGDATVRETRGILDGALNRVFEARLRALQAIYGGDAAAARDALRAYHVAYIVVSEDERRRFGTTAGQALEQLGREGVLTRMFDQGNVILYHMATGSTLPPWIATAPALEAPPIDGMLRIVLDQLPRIDDYAWNALATSYQPLAVLLWLLLTQILGLLAWPLTRRVFGRWHDGGWAWSKLLGLLLWGYVVWLVASFHLLPYSVVAVAFGLVLVGVVVAFAAGWRPRRGTLRTLFVGGLQSQRGAILRSEALFLVAFGAWLLVRAANPDLWHPYLGGEKPFEFGFLNAILRSPYMPPADPFFSGGVINYYYYSLFLMSLPIKAIGVAPAIGFNIAIAMLFALVVAGAAALVRELTGRWRYGLVGVLFVAILGPLSGAIHPERGLAFLLRNLQPGLAGWGGRIGDWFWGPSRTIPYTINEFPFFSYLFADLHPHMIMLPVTLLTMGLALELGRRVAMSPGPASRQLSLPLALGSLLVGTLAAANSWDAPTYALLLGGALAGGVWRLSRREQWAWRRTILAMLAAAGQTVLVVVVGLALYLPFFLQFQPMVRGVGLVQTTDTVGQFVLLYGVALFVVITLLVGLATIVLTRGYLRYRHVVRSGAVVASLVVLILLLGGWTFQEPLRPPGWSLRALLALLIVAGLVLLFVARLRDEEWTLLWLATVGLMVALGVEFVFIRDHLAGDPYSQRMNTVFKFGYQTWALLMVAAAAALPGALRLVRRLGDAPLSFWLIIFGGLVATAAVYPVAALPSRLNLRFAEHPGLTLDGLAFLQRAEYTHAEGERQYTIALRDDHAGIAWLNQNIPGLQVVFHSEREFYRAYGMRIAANTGLPTILGNLHENEQRPEALVAARARDAATLLNTPDTATAVRLLAQYGVDYVYIGPAERAFSDPVGLLKWNEMVGQALDVAWQQGTVTIYRVRDGLNPVQTASPAAAPLPVPTPPAVDTELESVEAQHAADPANGPLAFDLGGRYMRANRPADALRVLRTAAAANTRDIGLHHMLGDVESFLGHKDEAIAAWRKAVEIERSPGTLLKLGVELTKFGEWAEAEAALQEAARLDPNFTEATFSLAELYRMRNGEGDRERAAQAYEQYLAVAKPDAPWRAVAEDWLRELRKP